jgi:hypothetical protein
LDLRIGLEAMIGDWFRRRPRSALSKLIVVAFDLRDQSSHFFNELLGYQSAAEELGISATFLVPRKANPHFVKALSAKAVLDPLPRFSPVDSTDVGKKLQTFLKAPKKLEPLWRLVEAEDLSQIRAILCTQPNPALIHAAGVWLERHVTAPAVFFRFTNTFELAAKGSRHRLITILATRWNASQHPTWTATSLLPRKRRRDGALGDAPV